jgi:ribosomal protein L11 methylase PrmA
MLHAAALLTLDLAEKLLAEGIGLKDATPFNILFRGAKPVFVDWLSFEKRDANDPIWLSKAQFIRTFCLPLLVNKHFGFQLSWVFRVNRDGLEPEDVYRMSGWAKKLSPAFFSTVTLPKWLGSAGQKNSTIYQKQTVNNPEKAIFILRQQFKSLRRLLQKVAPNPANTSDWSEYIGEKQHFTDAYLKQKDAFVKNALEEFKPNQVLDVGCNTGYFSRIAAESGASVTAIDTDAVAVGKVWQMARRENLDILPLVVDISRPTPAIGWRNGESASFLSRVQGKMDGVLMLAVVHHLLVTERIPLSEILLLMAEITENILVIEFVPPDDKMFRQIARGRDHLFEYLTENVFREVCQKHFKVLRSEKLADSNRQIFLLQK